MKTGFIICPISRAVGSLEKLEGQRCFGPNGQASVRPF